MEECAHIGVCVCTYRRPQLLLRLLRELAQQDTRELFTFSVVVVDNDDLPSAEPVVRSAAATSRFELTYCTEPRRNISLARNRALEVAKGNLIAFIDDDEFPTGNWLLNLFRTLQRYRVAGVLGPVRPHFDETPPNWLRKGRFYERHEHATGAGMRWEECRTGNVLFERRIINGISPVFRPEFGTGGEDLDFFRRMIGLGHRFAWCNEAVVFEVVPPGRWKRSVMIQRALLRGSNSLRQAGGPRFRLLKSVIAIPLYVLALPFLHVGGHHLFMKYLIKLCDHLGRLLAFFGINIVRTRIMG